MSFAKFIAHSYLEQVESTRKGQNSIKCRNKKKKLIQSLTLKILMKKRNVNDLKVYFSFFLTPKRKLR